MPRVIGPASRLVLLVSVILLSIDSIVNAENLEAQKKALEAIADFADRICSTIPLKGDGKNLELTGNAKAELNEFLKKVANLGIEGAAKYQASEWQGVLQQDLAGQLNNSRNCKLEVYKDLKDKLLSQSKSSIDKAKNTTIALSIKEPAADLAKRAAKGVSFHTEAIGIVGEYNRMLQEAKARLPNEQSIQVLRELEYTKHDNQTAAMVATAARKLERVADQLMAGDMEAAQKTEDEKPKIPYATPPQLRSNGQNQQPLSEEEYSIDVNIFPTRPGEISGVTLRLYIDDKYVGDIGNMPSPKTIDVGKIKKGLHTFKFGNIKGYSVDKTGKYKPYSPISGLECEGNFAVTSSKTFYLNVWRKPSGTLTCGLQ